ncbi:hypothetical protein [Mesorhizobium sp. 113-3-3]|uniref:hypothetical protein n=1 Tax=Mesorhizobium sp. 113-3-3 TaxID=2744516 RepID=UPI0018EA4626|nr:hypothetical protein [Mesorhizobium sp. 113-3-3]BCG83434.1 hypothetical protein MesoLj113b_69760 [Mesorhizobium sp. 113-3-3]
MTMHNVRLAALAFAVLVAATGVTAAHAQPPKLGEAAATLAITEYAETNCPGLAVDHAKLAAYFAAGGFTADQLKKEGKYRHVRDIDLPGDVANRGAAAVCYDIQASWYVPSDTLRHKIVFKP